ncbi:hypothetical protein BOX15_Mlig017530g1 [Macrostomum lignano]|uniref:Uncharacterized protein n=2 Tax=Macrostomum lignano TaxID=282301 RepID=A0A267E3B0_9PLAT|nr:hypothetical protein BOX15_Mlig017530g1 [Macrostomum lignano]
MSENSENEEDQFFDCPEDPEAIQFASLDRIYAICLPATPSAGAASNAVATPCVAASGSEAWRERLLLFPSSGEALAKLKEHRNARYKVFNSYPEAKQFASSTVEQLTPKRPAKAGGAQQPGGSTDRLATAVQDTDSFKSVTQVQLNQLKAAIISGDLSTVSALVWNNPKHLVTDCDAPTLLMPRFRYNCLHQAALRNQSAVIKLLLAILSGDEFWRRLNADTGAELRRCRRNRLLDLYLNGREMALGETPLHIAAKFCYTECIRLLVARRECDINILNNAGQTALEIVGSRCDSASAGQLAETRLALSGQFVPLVAEVSTGVVRVSQPVPAWALQEMLDQPHRLLVRAYAGPAEPDTARSLYERWRAPSRVLLFCRRTAAAATADKDNWPTTGNKYFEDSDDYESSRPPRLPPASPVPGRPAGFEFQSPTNMLRTPPMVGKVDANDDNVDDAAAAAVAEVTAAPLLDYDKGYEITGRALCRALGGIAWHERWDFFDGDFADLATDEGLSRLNRLLTDAYERMEKELGVSASANTSGEDAVGAAAVAAAAAAADPWTDYRDFGGDSPIEDDDADETKELTDLSRDSCHGSDNGQQASADLSDSFLERVSRWGLSDSKKAAAAAQLPASLTKASTSGKSGADPRFRSPPPPPTSRLSKQQQAPRMSTPRQQQQRRAAPTSSPFEFVVNNGANARPGGLSFSSPSSRINNTTHSKRPVTPVDLQVLKAISPASSASKIDQKRYPSLARWRRSIGANTAASVSSEDVSKLLLQLPASPSPSPSLAAASPLASPLPTSPSLRRLAAAAAAGGTPRRRLAARSGATGQTPDALNKSFDHDSVALGH